MKDEKIILIFLIILINHLSYAQEYAPGAGNGIYLGAVLDWAEISNLNPEGSVVGNLAMGMADFNATTGKQHAIYQEFFSFPDGASWGSAVTDFLEATRRNDAAPMLTLEPWNNYSDFYTDWNESNSAFQATEALAQEVGAYQGPVFIRFAHEMNGSWYPWNTWNDLNKNLKFDPGEETGHTADDYKEAFRNVAEVFRQYAPNATLVWAPNQGNLSEERIDHYTPFYPGDDVVDWVALDIYERGFYQPDLNSTPWGGQFAYDLTHDSMDDPATPENESVNFYQTFSVDKNKPLMIAETSATLTYRTDLTEQERAFLSQLWKSGWIDSEQYGWLLSVYGTSQFSDLSHNYNIDELFPNLQAIIWFHLAKAEDVPTIKVENGQEDIVWFLNSWNDFRIGYESVSFDTKYDPNFTFPGEMQLYSSLISDDYFLSHVVPEPNSLLLLGSSLIIFLSLNKRRRR